MLKKFLVCLLALLLALGTAACNKQPPTTPGDDPDTDLTAPGDENGDDPGSAANPNFAVAEGEIEGSTLRWSVLGNGTLVIEGEGEIIGDRSIYANPRSVEFGSAPILVRSTRKAGKIRIKAEVEFPGTHAPTPAEIEFESVPARLPLCFSEEAVTGAAAASATKQGGQQLSDEEKRRLLEEVDRQQQEFGIQ